MGHADPRSRDTGSITGFVIVITLAVLACAGLVIDGARLVGGAMTATDHAENAARAGAQELAALHSGSWSIDAARAAATAEAYLARHALSGSVEVTRGSVSVTVTITVSTTLLRLAGVDSKTVRATRTSDPVSE